MIICYNSCSMFIPAPFGGLGSSKFEPYTFWSPGYPPAQDPRAAPVKAVQTKIVCHNLLERKAGLLGVYME